MIPGKFLESVNLSSTSYMVHPDIWSFLDEVHNVAIMVYTFILRHQILAIINIVVISLNLFFIWTFGKRKSSKLHSMSPRSDRSSRSTYNPFLKRLQARAQKHNTMFTANKNSYRSSNQHDCVKPAINVPKISPTSGNVAKASSHLAGHCSCSPTLESSSDEVEETLDEITWGFDTSPVSSHFVAERDSAGNCRQRHLFANATGAPVKSFTKEQPFFPKNVMKPDRLNAYRRSIVNTLNLRAKRLAAGPKVAINTEGTQGSREAKQNSTFSRSPRRPTRQHAYSVTKSGDSESSPAKVVSKRSCVKRRAAVPPKRIPRSSLLKPELKAAKVWEKEITSDSDDNKNLANIPRSRRHSESSEQGGNRSETSIVCKRDSWIWFSPETKPSDDNFFSRQNKFKSADPRVAELAAEIRRQEEMNKSIEREAESLIESSSQSHKYANQWAKPSGVKPTSRLKCRGRGKRCSAYSRSSAKKPYNSPRQLIKKQPADSHRTTNHSTPILPGRPGTPSYGLQELSPKVSSSQSQTFLRSEKEGKPLPPFDFKGNESITETSSLDLACTHTPADNTLDSNSNEPSHTLCDIGLNHRNMSNAHTKLMADKGDSRAMVRISENTASQEKKSCPADPVMGVPCEPINVLGSGILEGSGESMTSPASASGMYEGDCPRKRFSPSKHFSQRMSSPRIYRNSEFKPLPTGKKSPQVVLSTGESESESILRDTSGQENSFRQVIIRKEVNSAVHNLLFDTEQSSSSMSPTTINKVNASLRLRKLISKENSPGFLPKQFPNRCMSTQSSCSTVKAPLEESKKGNKRTNIYNPDYYLGKKRQAKKHFMAANSVLDSPSRWKKTDIVWNNPVSLRLYSPKPVTPSPVRRMQACMERMAGRIAVQKSNPTRQTSKVVNGKPDNSFVVHKSKTLPRVSAWPRHGLSSRSSIKKPLSSPGFSPTSASSKLSLKVPSNTMADLEAKIINKTTGIKMESPVLRSKMIKGEAVKPFGERTKRRPESPRCECTEGTLQFSSVQGSSLKANTGDPQQIITYSDSYWAKNIGLKRVKRADSNATLCLTKSPTNDLKVISQENGPVASEEIKMAPNVPHLIPGSTNNSSSSDPDLQTGTHNVSKFQVCDGSVQFDFVGSNKMALLPESEPYSETKSGPFLEMKPAGRTSYQTQPSACNQNDDETKQSRNISEHCYSKLSLELTRGTFPCSTPEEEFYSKFEKRTERRSPGVLSLADFGLNGAVHHAAQTVSNPDSGYEESVSDRSNFLQTSISRMDSRSMLGTLQSGEISQALECCARKVKVEEVNVSVSSCSQDSDLPTSVSPIANLYGSSVESSMHERSAYIVSTSEKLSQDKLGSNTFIIPNPRGTSHLKCLDSVIDSSGDFSLNDDEHSFLPCRKTTLSIDLLKDHNLQTEIKLKKLSTGTESILNKQSDYSRNRMGGKYMKRRKCEEFLLDCSLSSSLGQIDYSPEASSSITNLIPSASVSPALEPPSRFFASKTRRDVSCSTSQDIRLMESLDTMGSLDTASKSMLGDDNDTTFDRSLLSDMNSDLTFSDSLARNINVVRPADDREAPQDASYSDTFNTTDLVHFLPFPSTPGTVTRKSNQTECSTGDSRFHGKFNTLTHHTPQILSHENEIINFSNKQMKDRIPVRSVAFRELLRRF